MKNKMKKKIAPSLHGRLRWGIFSATLASLVTENNALNHDEPDDAGEASLMIMMVIFTLLGLVSTLFDHSEVANQPEELSDFNEHAGSDSDAEEENEPPYWLRLIMNAQVQSTENLLETYIIPGQDDPFFGEDSSEEGKNESDSEAENSFY